MDLPSQAQQKSRLTPTAQKMKFSIKDFSSKCGQIRSFLRTWSHLLKKSLMENFIFCTMPLPVRLILTISLPTYLLTALNESKISKLLPPKPKKKPSEYFFRSSRPEVYLRKAVLKICSKFTGEHSFESVISIKLQSNFIEITFRQGCSRVSLLHVLRTPFSKDTSGRMLDF